MKTLVDCKPSEFLKQTNRIRKAVAKWLTDTDIMNIRKRMPEIPKGVTADDAARLGAEQARKNLDAIFDAMLDEHPAETLEVLALCCFVEPEDVDNQSIKEYLAAFTKLISDETVISFFISLMRLGQIDISGPANP